MPKKIRAILDEAQWNSQSDPSHGTQNQIKPDAPLSYSGVNEERFPAPISSAERQELCARIERVQIA